MVGDNSTRAYLDLLRVYIPLLVTVPIVQLQRRLHEKTQYVLC